MEILEIVGQIAKAAFTIAWAILLASIAKGFSNITVEGGDI